MTATLHYKLSERTTPYMGKTAAATAIFNLQILKCKGYDVPQYIRMDVWDLGSFSKAFVQAHRKSQPNTLHPNTLVICTRVHPVRIRAKRKAVAEFKAQSQPRGGDQAEKAHTMKAPAPTLSLGGGLIYSLRCCRWTGIEHSWAAPEGSVRVRVRVGRVVCAGMRVEGGE
jgi:hypothetical protein